MAPIPKRQRVFIMQGGGALGAYEAGIFEVISSRIKRKDPNWKTTLFDVVAGASIGAINATVLVDHYQKSKSWEGSAESLLQSWNQLKNNTWVDYGHNPAARAMFESMWNFMDKMNPALAHPEGARRYWSWVQLANTPYMGAKNLSWTIPKFDYKFLDANPFDSAWLGYDYAPLRSFLSENVNFPIKNQFGEGPRLLLVGVDVQDCTEAVAFDSYPRDANEWYSSYARSDGGLYKVKYDGIGLDQLLASCMFPYSLYHPRMVDQNTGKERTFWDGAFLSNTPLREVLQRHRDYWLRYFEMHKMDYDRGADEKAGKPRVPDLDVYIVNLYPSTEDQVPADLDAIRDREIDIKFHDRTKYDEQVAHLVSDYINLVQDFIALARSKKAAQSEIDSILNKDRKLRSEDRAGHSRRNYRELLEGRFEVNVVRIDRQDDGNTIFGKHADFSATTIDSLIEAGRRDANRIPDAEIV
ncbi:MAG: patatin-like phospholipase family protein [Nitrososphaera sp.]